MFPNLKLDGILEGEILEQAAPNTTLRTLALVLMKGGQRTKIPDQNLAISANASGNPRVDMVQWSGAALTVKAGVAAVDPDSPAPDAGNIPIAIVWVPSGFTQARNIGSAVAQAKLIALYFVWGLFGWRVGTDTVAAGIVDIADTKMPVYITRVHAGYRAELNCMLQHTVVGGGTELAIASINLNGVTFGQTGRYQVAASTALDFVPCHLSLRNSGTGLAPAVVAGINKWQPRIQSGGASNVTAIQPQIFLAEWA